MRPALIATLALFVCLASAHDVLVASTVAVCVNGPGGYGPYVNWTVYNDWNRLPYTTVTVRIDSVTNLGPPPQSFVLQPMDAPGDRKSFLQALAATTTIRGNAYWTDGGKVDPWSKSTTVRAPAGCSPCTSLGQLCGSQTGTPVCKAMLCAADNSCALGSLVSDARCPSKQGVAGGSAMCTQQSCVGGACVTSPYNDPACTTTPLPQGVSAECNRMVCIGTTCQAVPWYYPDGAPVGSPPLCTGPTPATTCNRWVCMMNTSSTTAYCGLQADPAAANFACDDDNNLCTSQQCVVNARTNVASCSVATELACPPASPAKCLGAGVCVPSTGLCAFPPASDNTNCYSDAVNDANCTNYQCFRGACVRNCLCGNGILDDGETCDWGADAWCPIPPGEAAGCPPGLQPGNNGTGNHLGLNDPTTWCNATCAAVRLHRHGMSGGAIAGAAIGAAAGAALLMGAGFLLYRHNAGQTVGTNYATSEMHGRAHNNPTFLTPSTPSSNPHYVQMQ